MLESATTLTPEALLSRVAHLPADARHAVTCALESCRLLLLLPAGTRVTGPLDLDPGRLRCDGQEVDALLVEGDLTIDGAALNADGDAGLLLVVLGTLYADRVVHGGGSWVVADDLVCPGVVVGFYNHGHLWVGGSLQAEALVVDDHAVSVAGEVRATRIDHEGRELLVPEVIDFYESEPGRLTVDSDALVKRARAGRPLLRGAQPSLHHAADAGDLEALSRSRRREVDGGDAQGATALMVAARAGRPDVVERLLVAGARVDRADRAGRTPLHWAGSAEVVRLLLTSGAALDAVDREGNTALARAVDAGDRPVTAALLEAGARLDVPSGAWPLLPLALGARLEPGSDIDEELALLLIAKGADPREVDRQGLDPLQRAATSDSPRVVAALLAAGADPGRRGPGGVTALQMAAAFARSGNVALLLERSRPADRAGEAGRLLLACALGGRDVFERDIAPFRARYESPERLEVARLLVAAGVRADGVFEGWPLALLSPDPQVLALLLQAGADPNAVDAEGNSVLVRALTDAPAARDRALVQVLLAHGADPTRPSPDGVSPAELAAGTSDRDLLELILHALNARVAVTIVEADALRRRADAAAEDARRRLRGE